MRKLYCWGRGGKKREEKERGREDKEAWLKYRERTIPQPNSEQKTSATMVTSIISISSIISNSHKFSLQKRLLQSRFFPSQPFSSLSLIPTTISGTPSPTPFQFLHSRIAPSFRKPLCTSSSAEAPANPIAETPKRNTLVNFSMSDSEFDSDSDSDSESERENVIDKSKLPPPYDPFGKKPAIEEIGDPKNLSAVFHKIRTDGIMNSAVKIFDGLSKDGLTHQALEFFFAD